MTLPPLTPSQWPRFPHNKKRAVKNRSRSNSEEDATAVAKPNPSKLPIIVMTDPAQTTIIETTQDDGAPVLVFNTTIPRGMRRGEEFYLASNSPFTAASSCSSSTTSASALSLVRVTCPRECKPGRHIAIIVPKDVATDASQCCNSLIKDVVGDHMTPSSSSTRSPSSRAPVPTEIQVDKSEHWDVMESDEDRRDDCGVSRVSNHHHELLSTPASDDRTVCEQSRLDTNETRTHTTAKTALSSPHHYQVTVPPNVLPGQTLTVLAGGRRVQVTCPDDAVPGSTIRF